MRQFTTILLSSLLMTASFHIHTVHSAEIQPDAPIAPSKQVPSVKPSQEHHPDNGNEKLKPPVRPDIKKKTPAHDHVDEEAPALDPDAEQINRGALSPH